MRENRSRRLLALAGILGAVLLVYLGVLYNIQVNEHEEYLAKSIHSIAQEETIEASRGVITDRKGRVLVSNRSVYNLSFDSSLLKTGQDQNEAILRLLENLVGLPAHFPPSPILLYPGHPLGFQKAAVFKLPAVCGRLQRRFSFLYAQASGAGGCPGGRGGRGHLPHSPGAG